MPSTAEPRALLTKPTVSRQEVRKVLCMELVTLCDYPDLLFVVHQNGTGWELARKGSGEEQNQNRQQQDPETRIPRRMQLDSGGKFLLDRAKKKAAKGSATIKIHGHKKNVRTQKN